MHVRTSRDRCSRPMPLPGARFRLLRLTACTRVKKKKTKQVEIRFYIENGKFCIFNKRIGTEFTVVSAERCKRHGFGRVEHTRKKLV